MRGALAASMLVACGRFDDVSEPYAASQQEGGHAIAAPRRVSKIIDGTLDSQTYPAVGVLLQYTSMGEMLGTCTGTLIAPDVVLTAKHCLPNHTGLYIGGRHEEEYQGPAPNDMVFVMGAKPLPLLSARVYPVRHASFPLEEDPEQSQRFYYLPLFYRQPMTRKEQRLLEDVAQLCGSDLLKLHGQQRLRCLAQLPSHLLRELGVPDEHIDVHDVALVFLAKAVTDVAPMPLFAGDLADVQQRTMKASPAGAESIKAIGYGLHMLPPQVVGPMQTLQRRSGRATMSCLADHMFQLDQEQSTCFGDSGGPVVYESNGRISIIGITSGADARPEHQCRRGNLFVRADTYIDWIEAAMQRGCETGDRLPQSCGL